MQLTRNVPASWRHVALQYFALTKPRVVLLAAFCALIGMLLATDGPLPWSVLVAGLAGISLLAGAGFAFNCLTSYSDHDKMRDYLYYADPLAIFDHCKKHYAKDVALLHDYGLYEFTILVRKQR